MRRTWALLLVFAIPTRIVGSLRDLLRRIAAALRTVAEYVWVRLVRLKRILLGTNPSRSEAAFSLLLLTSIAGVVGTFLFDQSLVAYPLVGMVGLGVVGWGTYQARTAKLLMLFATIATVLTIGFITYFLFERAWTPIQEFGLNLLAIPRHGDTGEPRWFFFLDWLDVLPVTAEGNVSGWDPRNGYYSLLAAAWATVIVTVIAVLVAGPLGVLGALFIAEIASDRVRSVVKPAIEILAGIPSIVYGFIGFAVLNTFMSDTFLDPGASFLIAGLVVGVMALPTVVSVSEDALSAVPDSMRDGSAAMGATNWQTMKSISLPAAFSGISAAIILGLGRALGETMAVAAIMSGGANFARPLYDIFDQSVTLTSRIATSYGSSTGMTKDVLFVAGVMLFSIVAVMSLLAQYVERRMERQLQGEQ